jgi:quercetin dioxygenase-like cupin family protein
LLAAPVAYAEVPPGTIQFSADDISWKPAPPTMPAGTQIAVLEGDPSKPGMFTIRLKAPAGSAIAPHTHPRPERVTVLSGAVEVGFGETATRESVRRFEGGSFYVNPPGFAHFLFIPEETVLQITGEGPWQVIPANRQTTVKE